MPTTRKLKMISKNTANNFLSVAQGDNIDFFFKAASEIHGQLKQQPTSEQIWARWNQFSSENLLSLIPNISDSDLLDKILIKEKRKTVLRTIAANSNLSLVSRMYLYQHSFTSDDYELRNLVLQFMEADFYIALALEDSSLSNHRNTNLTFSKLAEVSSEELVKQYFTVNGTEHLSVFATHNMGLANKIAKELDYQKSSDGNTLRYGRKGNQIKEPTVDEYREFLSIFSSPEAVSYVVNRCDGDLKLLAHIDSNLLKEYFKQKSDFTLEDVELAETYNLIPDLAKISHSTDSMEAAERLINLAGPTNCRKLILNHPDRRKAIEWFKANYQEMLMPLEQNSYKVTQFADEFCEELGLESFWEIYDKFNEQNLSGATLELLNKNGFSYPMIIKAMPLRFVSKIKHFPNSFDYSALYSRYNEIEEHRVKVSFLETILENIVPRYGDDPYKEEDLVLNLIPDLYEVGAKDTILNLLYRRNINDKASTLIYNIIRNDPEMLENSVKNFSYRSSESLKGIIDLIAPKQGWGSMLRSRDITETIYDYLAIHLGDDQSKWETAFTVFDDWKGTLPELIHMCEHI